MSQQQPPEWTPPDQQPRPANINDYAPPRTNIALIVVAVVVGALLLGVLLMLTQPYLPIAPTQSPTPTPSSTSAQPSWGMPFMTEDGICQGRWEITSQNWRDDGLDVSIRVSSDQCPFNLFFSVVSNEEAFSYEPVVDGSFMEYTGLHLQSGQERSGSLFFPMTKTSSIIMMTDDNYAQLSALEVAD
ncbi:MAG: hypothetical protein LBK28_00800 [Propionibacteriaceae bacterium]|jgi:hypothetical protein|nr:hypothetical protein [Propionibacteriaceae bacterium]